MADWQPPELTAPAKAWQPPEIAAPAKPPDTGSTIGGLWQNLVGGAKFEAKEAYLRATAGDTAGVGALFRSLLPGQAGAKAGGEIAGSALEGTGAFVGGELAPPPTSRVPVPPQTPAQALSQDFRAQGVRQDVPTIGQGRGVGIMAQAGRLLPASPVESAIRQRVAQTGQAAERAAAGYGAAATPEQAGGVIQRAMRHFGEDTTQSHADYANYDRMMFGAPPSETPNTLRALQDFEKKYPNAPELNGVFANPKLARIREAITPRTVEIPAKTSPILGPSGTPIETAAARTEQRGLLTPQEKKNLRTEIINQIDNPKFGPDEPRQAELRKVFAALSKDLYADAAKRSPAAARALAKASGNYKLRLATRDDLQAVLGKPDEPGVATERFFNRVNSAAQQSGQANAGLLLRLRRVMPFGEWGNVGATIIRRLGNPTAGAKDALGEDFSVSSYATNWNKLSDKAKDVLFGPNTPSSPRAGLEQLSRVAQAQKNVSRLANTSHSGEMLGVMRLVQGVVTAVAAGHFPWATAMGLTGAYGASKLLMSPGFTQWLYQLPRITRGVPTEALQLQRALGSLQMYLSHPEGPREPERSKVGGVGPQGGTVTNVTPVQ